MVWKADGHISGGFGTAPGGWSEAQTGRAVRIVGFCPGHSKLWEVHLITSVCFRDIVPGKGTVLGTF